MRNIELPNTVEETLLTSRELAKEQGKVTLISQLNTLLSLVQLQEFVNFPIRKSSLVGGLLFNRGVDDNRLRFVFVNGDTWEYELNSYKDKVDLLTLIANSNSVGAVYNNAVKGKLPGVQIF